MSTGEFDLIQRHFKDLTAARTRVKLGIGDDCALLCPPEGELLAVSTDVLVADVHFDANAGGDDVGHKALAVNLSDLAAAGARPLWATLTLTLPKVDEAWVAGFCRGFAALADRHSVALVGGDLSRGPLNVGVQIMGSVVPGRELRRGGAAPGDLVFVSGTLGDAAAGLELGNAAVGCDPRDLAWLIGRLTRPEPRIALGRVLGGSASAAIDLSDGLCQDLGHLLQSSGCGASLDLNRLPLSKPLRRALGERSLSLALHGGDDYELCFTVPPSGVQALSEAACALDVAITRIGVIEEPIGLRAREAGGTTQSLSTDGYRHF